MAEIGGLGADLVGKLQIQIHAAFVGNGRKVQHTVGGAPQSHIHRQRIQKSIFGHDVPGADVLPYQVHHRHPGVLGQLYTGGIDGGNRPVAA